MLTPWLVVVAASTDCGSDAGLGDKCAHLAAQREPGFCRRLYQDAQDPERFLAKLPPIRGDPRRLVLGIGFGDTGTRSIAEALRAFGLRVRHFDPSTIFWCLRKRDFTALAGIADAWSDTPVGGLWRILIRVFPNYRAILTTRADYNRAYRPKEPRCVPGSGRNFAQSMCVELGSAWSRYRVPPKIGPR